MEQADLSRKLAYTIAELTKMGLGGKAYIYTQIAAGCPRCAHSSKPRPWKGASSGSSS
jgi:hypothetical protein